LAVDEFARLLGLTRAHLRDACLRGMGTTPLGVIHARLMEEACLRLEQTELSIEQIGYSLGFRDPGYFNRFFKRQAGLSPGAYRKAAARPAQHMIPHLLRRGLENCRADVAGSCRQRKFTVN
jgi:AraC family transcriptional activator of pobA